MSLFVSFCLFLSLSDYFRLFCNFLSVFSFLVPSVLRALNLLVVSNESPSVSEFEKRVDDVKLRLLDRVSDGVIKTKAPDAGEQTWR